MLNRNWDNNTCTSKTKMWNKKCLPLVTIKPGSQGCRYIRASSRKETDLNLTNQFEVQAIFLEIKIWIQRQQIA